MTQLDESVELFDFKPTRKVLSESTFRGRVRSDEAVQLIIETISAGIGRRADGSRQLHVFMAQRVAEVRD